MKMRTFDILIILLIALSAAGIIISVYYLGYSSANKDYETARNQRDRLADYIRIYEDMQDDNFDAADSVSLRDFINDIEHEDNIDAMRNCMPPMNIDDWCYAY